MNTVEVISIFLGNALIIFLAARHLERKIDDLTSKVDMLLEDRGLMERDEEGTLSFTHPDDRR